MTDPALLLDPDALQIDADPSDDELEALLTAGAPAAGVVFPDRELAESVLLEAVYDEARHPHWPAGAKDAAGKTIGGQFMRVGERFTKDGHVWEIAHVAQGHIIANEASGDIGKAETRVFAPTEVGGVNTIKDAAPAPLPVIEAGQAASYTGTGLPVVDAEAKDNHDPALKLPEGSALTADEWKRFGEVDQRLYIALAERFGPWKQGFAAKVTPKLMAEYSSKAQQALKSAFTSQYGSGFGSAAGDYMSLQQVFSGHHDLAEAQKVYREARELQGDIKEANAWELFNRLHSPDVSVIHWGSGGSHNQKLVAGQTALKPGYSTSWSSSITTFGSHATSFAVAARHVLLATDLSKPAGSHFAHEHEFTTGDRLKLSTDIAHSYSSTALKGPLSKWFNDHFGAHGGSMRPGALIKAMHAHMKGEGTLPLPPPPPGLVYDSEGKQLWHAPPADVITKASELAKAAGYAHGETAEQALKPISQLGLEPGDLIEGHTIGKRYLVIADPGSPLGVRYMKLDGSMQTFTFGSESSERRKLEATVKLPPPPKEEGIAPFEPEQWTQTGVLQPLGKMATGDKVLVNSDYFEVTGQAGAHTLLKSLVNGKTAKANAGFPTAALGPKPGYTPPGVPEPEPDLEAGQWALFGGSVPVKLNSQAGTGWNVTMPTGTETVLQAEHLKPFPMPDLHPGGAQKGDTFTHAGEKMVVTNVLKSGAVRARVAKPGAKVQEFAPDHPALGTLFRPSDYTPGAKSKLGQMEPGQLVSGSPLKVKPYMVLGGVGKQTYLMNLDTGEVSSVSKNKSWPALVTPSEDAPVEPQAEDKTLHSHEDFQPGDKVLLAQLHVGDQFSNEYGSYTIASESAGKWGTEYWDCKDPEGNTYTINKAMTEPVTFLGTPEQPQPTAAPVEPGSLPDAAEGGFVAFTSNAGSGNSYKHDKLNMLAEGEHFFDKNGKLWKVKKAGETPIITDGQANFQVNGKSRVKRAEHAKKGFTPLSDQSPPVGSIADHASLAAASVMDENPAQYSLADLKLQKGDTFAMNGATWTVKSSLWPGALSAVKDGTAASKLFSSSYIPEKFLKKGGSTPPEPAVFEPVPEPGLAAAGQETPAEAVAAALNAANAKKVTPSEVEAQMANPTIAGIAQNTPALGWVTAAYNAYHEKHGEVAPDGTHDALMAAAEGALGGQRVPVVNHMLTGSGELKPSHEFPANTIAQVLDGPMVHKTTAGDWVELGGDPVAIDGSQPVMGLKLTDEVPKPADLSKTGQMVDVHDIPVGQVFLAGVGSDKPFLMLAHGPAGATAVNLETGTVLPAPAGSHKDFELATWTPKGSSDAESDLASPEGPHLGPLVPASELPVGSHFAVADAVWKKTSPFHSVMVKKTGPQQYAELGHKLYGPDISDLEVQQVPPPEAKSQPLADMAVGTRYWSPSAAAEYEVLARNVGITGEPGGDYLHVKGVSNGDEAFVPMLSPQAKHEFVVTHEGATTVGDLAAGDKFTVPEGYFAGGSEHEVIDPSPIFKDGYQVVKTKHVATGKEGLTATQLVPASVTSAASSEPPMDGWKDTPSGSTVKNTPLQPGDKFLDFDGDEHTVVSSSGDPVTSSQMVTSTYTTADGQRVSPTTWSSLLVTKIKHTAAAPAAPPAPVAPGAQVPAVGTPGPGQPTHWNEGDPIGWLEPGDSYSFSGPHATWTVLSKDAEGVHVSDGSGHVETMPLDHSFKEAPKVTYAVKAAAMPISPYGSPYQSGGKVPYHKIKDLQPGDEFQDKAGQHFKVLEHEGDHTLATPWANGMATGDPVVVDHSFTAANGKAKPTRVKKLSSASVPEDAESGMVADFVAGKTGSFGKWHIDHVGGSTALYHDDLPLAVRDAQGHVVVTPVHYKQSVSDPLEKVKAATSHEVASSQQMMQTLVLAHAAMPPPTPPPSSAPQSVFSAAQAWLTSKGVPLSTVVKIHKGAMVYHEKGSDWPTAYKFATGDNAPPDLLNKHAPIAEVVSDALKPKGPVLPKPVDAAHEQAMSLADEWLQSKGVPVASIDKTHADAADWKLKHGATTWGKAYQLSAAVHGEMTGLQAQPLKDLVDGKLPAQRDVNGVALHPGDKVLYDGEDATYQGPIPGSPAFAQLDGPVGGSSLSKIEKVVSPSSGLDSTGPMGKMLADFQAGVVSQHGEFKVSKVGGATVLTHQFGQDAPEPYAVTTATGTYFVPSQGKTWHIQALQDALVAGGGEGAGEGWIQAKIEAQQAPSAPGDAASGKTVKPYELHVGDVFENDVGGRFEVTGKFGSNSLKFTKISGEGADTGTLHMDSPVSYKLVPAKPPVIPDYTGTVLSGGKAAGGSTGAQILTGPGGSKWLRKTYGGNQDRVATELLANRIYAALGVKVADAGVQKKPGGGVALAYPLVDGETEHFSTKYGEGNDTKRQALGDDFMADALVANYDFVGLDDDNVLWNGDEPTRIDQGGTFFYRAQGDPKPFGDVPTEAFTMLSKGQGKRGVITSESSMRQQAAHIAQTLTPAKIDALVNAAPFKDEQMREKLRSALKARVKWMGEFGDGLHDIPDDVPLQSLTSEPGAFDPEPEPAGAVVKAKDLKPGDKIKAMPGHSVAGNYDDEWVVNGSSDNGHYWSLTNAGGWLSTTIPKDESPVQHIGHAPPDPAYLSPHDLEPAMPITPYGSPYQSGGKAPYHKVAELAPGDQFRDKTGQLFTVKGHNIGGVKTGQTFMGGAPVPEGHTFVRDAAGKALFIPHTFTDPKSGKSKVTRVKKV